MGRLGLREIVSYYFRKNISLFVFITIIFAAGVAVGSFSVNLVQENDKYELGVYIETFLEQFEARTTLNNTNVVKQSILGNLKVIGLAYVLGLSVIGVPFLLLVIFIRGFVLGFTVGFFIDELFLRGMLLTLVSVFPQNLIIVPCIIVSSVAAVSFSGALIRGRTLRHKGSSLSSRFVKFSAIEVMMVFAMFFAGLIEAYVTPFLIHLCTRVML